MSLHDIRGNDKVSKIIDEIKKKYVKEGWCNGTSRCGTQYGPTQFGGVLRNKNRKKLDVSKSLEYYGIVNCSILTFDIFKFDLVCEPSIKPIEWLRRAAAYRNTHHLKNVIV